jgi:hypothetical protein
MITTTPHLSAISSPVTITSQSPINHSQYQEPRIKERAHLGITIRRGGAPASPATPGAATAPALLIFAALSSVLSILVVGWSWC